MKASNSLWKQQLDGKMPEELAREIDIFETEITLRKQGKLEERLFAETRLRRGAYGQRYDNGQRNDGQKVQKLNFPSGDFTKGPNTMWDAPGMQRIKVPAGGLNAAQLETMAELAEEYSDGIAHVTTRQDFQLHYIHIDDTPALMEFLRAAGANAWPVRPYVYAPQADGQLVAGPEAALDHPHAVDADAVGAAQVAHHQVIAYLGDAAVAAGDFARTGSAEGGRC